MSKRVREFESESDVQVFSPSCYIETLPNVLLTHLLGFAWNHTYRLSLVNKRFLSIVRSRAFWRLLGQHALKGIFPQVILKQVNFFYDLKRNDPAHAWLWGLLAKDSKSYYIQSKNDYVSFRRKDTNECFRIVNKHDNSFLLIRYSSDRKNLVIQPFKEVKSERFNRDYSFLEVYMYIDEKHEKTLTLYVKRWNKNRQKYWNGATKDPIDNNPEEGRQFEPLEPFGGWTDN